LSQEKIKKPLNFFGVNSKSSLGLDGGGLYLMFFLTLNDSSLYRSYWIIKPSEMHLGFASLWANIKKTKSSSIEKLWWWRI